MIEWNWYGNCINMISAMYIWHVYEITGLVRTIDDWFLPDDIITVNKIKMDKKHSTFVPQIIPFGR